jgi:acyl transferase domain-containing protein
MQIKANVGHSEPAAGISAMIKVILSLENAVIPGNPTFITPNPKIDFDKLRIAPSRYARRWHSPAFRRASINSFGYGGSNAHVVVDEYRGAKNHVTSYAAVDVDDLFVEDEQQSRRPLLLAFSANDQQSLESQFSALDRHLSDPAVSVRLRDLAYTLSERRSRHYHRAYTLADDLRLESQTLQWGTAMAEPPKIGLIMTGQGAQWSEMGKDLLEFFPAAASRVHHLDKVLQNLPDPPEWSLLGKHTTRYSFYNYIPPHIL